MDSNQPELPGIEETPENSPHLFIEVRTQETEIVDGNGQQYEVQTGRTLTSYRRRTPEDGAALFVVGQSKPRHIPVQGIPPLGHPSVAQQHGATRYVAHETPRREE